MAWMASLYVILRLCLKVLHPQGVPAHDLRVSSNTTQLEEAGECLWTYGVEAPQAAMKSRDHQTERRD
jgi:hypothetical protein